MSMTERSEGKKQSLLLMNTCRWLQEQLRSGAKPVAQLIEQARAELQVSEHALRRAKRMLGVRTVRQAAEGERSASVWMWELGPEREDQPMAAAGETSEAALVVEELAEGLDELLGLLSQLIEKFHTRRKE